MAADAAQWLMAAIDPGGGEIQLGTWSADPILAGTYHRVAHSEFLLAAILSDPAAHLPAAALYDRWLGRLPYPRQDPAGRPRGAMAR
jgi:hypothetical protein